MILIEHDLDEFLAKRTGATGDQYDLITPVHDDSMLSIHLGANFPIRVYEG
jgi:hypothetical protein